MTLRLAARLALFVLSLCLLAAACLLTVSAVAVHGAHAWPVVLGWFGGTLAGTTLIFAATVSKMYKAIVQLDPQHPRSIV